jgi:alkanesulfonate monooxygenase SsuD/methylene tetrahydromethanopterin reductase-like flavin-dependent oxidoreductase (luciferase family)
MGIQFSLLNAVRNLPQAPYNLTDVYADYISDAVLAEELGFKGAFFGEHHFRECQWTGSPILVATAVAAKTERLRVGTAVSLLPFHDPIRIAEDVAIADVISGGRFDFGIGPGSQYEEFRTFGVDPKEMNGRTWESIDWIQRAFAENDEFSHEGRYYQIPDMTFTTKPVQNPIPVWYGGMGPRNQRRAAERGFHFIGPFNPGYDAQLAAAGRTPSDYQVASMQVVCVADSTDQAWQIAGPGLEYFVNFYELRKNLQGEPADPSARVTQKMIRDGNAGFWSAAAGTPDDVIRALTPFVTGAFGRITELACGFRHPGMRNEETHHSMRLFADHVMPTLRELSETSAAP